MNRSGMKKGLAVSAVSALAITGITVGIQLSASAAGGVEFVTQVDSTIASVQNDGADSTIHLQATGPASASKMLFEYSTNGGGSYTAIGTVTPTAGLTGDKLFSIEWAPPASVNNTTVRVRAQAISSVDTPIGGSADTNDIDVSTTADAVNLGNAAASELGVYQRPGDARVNGIVTGTTSDIVGGASVDVDSVTGTGGVTAADFFGPVAGSYRTFSGVADFVGDAVDSNGDPVNQTYALARATDDADDVEAVRLYRQEISSGTSASISRTLIPVGETASVTVTVLDQKGKPIAGARVRREGGPAAPQITNSRGQATFNGLTPSPSGTNYRYYVDNNDNGNYEEASEFARTFTLSSYVAEAKTIGASSDLGKAWDRDETAAVTIKVGDQNGLGFGPQQVQYQWSIGATEFPIQTEVVAGGGPNKGTVNIGDVPSNAEGTWTLKSWIENNGNPGLNGDTISETTTFKVGQASLKWDDGNVAQNPVGTVGRVYKGTLALADGTPLTGRSFPVTLGALTGADNAVMAAQAAQPAGTNRSGDLLADVTTDASGKFGVAVSDPGGAANAKEDRTLSADAGDFASVSPLEIDFLDTTVATVAQAAGSAVSIDGATRTPGRPVNVGAVTVTNQYGELLTDKDVNVAVDRGYLTPGGATAADLTPAVAKVDGGLVGAWKNDGTSKSVVTADGPVLGGAGRGVVDPKVASAVDADAGFNDDGSVDIKITATSGGKNDVETNTFSSDNPLNPGSPVVTYSADNFSKILPKSATTTNGGNTQVEVKQQVVVPDQFGNRTDSPVTLTDDSATATVNPSANGQYAGDTSSPIVTKATASGSQTVTATFAGRSNVWSGAAVSSSAKNVSGNGPTTSWYVVDLSASKYTLTNTGTSSNPVGSTVTSTYTALDQENQPLIGYHTEIFRTGPDVLQNGNPQTSLVTGTTNASGKSIYTFQGAAAGKAIVAGVLFDNADNPVEASRISQTLVFANPTTPPAPPVQPAAIKPKLTAFNQVAGKDTLRVAVPKKAAGATVTFFKFVNGSKVRVGYAKVNADGVAVLRVNDKNKKGLTYYSANVGKTKLTKVGVSNTAKTK